MKNKYLIAYFSKTQNTEKIAKELGNLLDADFHEIKEKVEYKPEDINWTVEDCRANRENNDPQCRPDIQDEALSDNFDVLLLGFPLWWGEPPKVIRTFLEKNEDLLKSKKIVIFCTSQMTPIYQAQMNLRYGYPKLKFVSGARLSNYSPEQIKAWTKTFDR
ncbi:flavodoxin [uncultured Lactobacillus sp.]|uniref:flavodoxin n=1 Tax=uncultured Lactobacillus sp. TaxID=153152 RepID=UPI0026184A33|nr:flavodoxin [uncultured Lactobacillus sp.]